MIAVIDYGVGNLFSLVSSLKAIGVQAVVTADPALIKSADKILFISFPLSVSEAHILFV